MTFETQMADELTLDPARTAMLTIDLQRDYLDPAVAQALVAEETATPLLAATKHLLNTCRSLGIPVVHAYSTRRQAEIDENLEFGGVRLLLDSRERGLSQHETQGPKKLDRLMGTAQAEVHPDLLADGDIHVPTKKTFDSYLYSDLDLVLGRLIKADTVLISGINTDSCVYSTTFSTANRGYRPVVVSDCTASMRGRDRHDMALTLMSRSIAWVVSLEQALEKLGADQPAAVAAG